ncbi:MAG: HAMP domain-containing histidine kinase [Sulfurospirillum sp.]|nr:HAMP domain-containing histidine kinase [Sulfurospirillum sp.]
MKNKNNLLKSLLGLLGVFILGFISIIALHLIFENIIKNLDQDVKNESAKHKIGEYIVRKIDMIQMNYYQMATVYNIRGLNTIEKEIQKEIADIKKAIRILEVGGTLKNYIDLNVVGINDTKEIITFVSKDKVNFIFEAIDLMPKLQAIENKFGEMHQIIELKNDLISGKIAQTDVADKLFEVQMFYKGISPLFIRMKENANRLLYDSKNNLDKLEKDIFIETQYYEKLQIIVSFMIMVVVIILGSIVIRQILENNKQLEFATLQARKLAQRAETLFNIQNNIVILSTLNDGRAEMIQINQTFFDIFNFVDKNDFLSQHDCICDLFIPKEGYLHKIMGEKTWIEILLSEPQNSHLVLMKDKFNNELIFSIQAKHVQLETETFIISSLTNVSELEYARTEAQAAERAKSAFLATMSHELRTPLNAVIGFSQILMKKTDMPQESMKNYIEKIYTSGKHLLELVNNILDFSKIEDGKMEIHPAKIDLESFMTNTRTLVETAANKKNISITQENFTGKTLVADEQLIRQVLLNLLSNSIKFTPQGKKITLTCKENEAEVIISVCDEGPGLSSEQLEKLFKPFSQIKEHQNEAIKGTGLGLAISQKIMDLHHGFIKVQSELGKGSCFDMHLPKGKICNPK